jgi:hypothetical protein
VTCIVPGCLQGHALAPPTFGSQDINRRCVLLLSDLQRAISDRYHNGAYTILDAVSNLLYSIDDYHLTLPDNVSISWNEWHYFTHLMHEANELWHRELSGRQI